MRGMVGPIYWAVAGAMVGFGLIGLMTIGGPFLFVGAVMVLVGLLWPLATTISDLIASLRRTDNPREFSGNLLRRIDGVWAFLVGFGGLPALVLLSTVVQGIRSALNPYCAQPGGPGTAVPADAGPIGCAFVPASYYAIFAFFATVAILGVAPRLLLRYTGRRSPSR